MTDIEPELAWREARNWALHAVLPETVPLMTILAAHDIAQTNATGTMYRWNGWTFAVPPGVFEPSATNRFLCGLMLDGTVQVHGLRFAAMGAGLGVEAVVAGLLRAASVHAFDVHPESIQAAAAHYERIAGSFAPPFEGIVSDLWDELLPGTTFDVVTFNPPLIDFVLSDDPYIVRNRCGGRALAARYLSQLRTRRVLDRGGVAYLTVTNTAPLRDVVALALDAGFDVRAPAMRTWPVEGVQTYLLALTERPRP